MGRLAALCMALAAFGAGTAAAKVGAFAQPERIVFAADRAPSLNGEIYRLDPEGRRIDLSRSPALDTDPAVSPDGKLVAFSSNRGGRVALYTVRLDGSGLKRISAFFLHGIASLPSATSLAWSPDGKRLLATLPDGLWVSGRHIGHGEPVGAAW